MENGIGVVNYLSQKHDICVSDAKVFRNWFHALVTERLTLCLRRFGDTFLCSPLPQWWSEVFHRVSQANTRPTIQWQFLTIRIWEMGAVPKYLPANKTTLFTCAGMKSNMQDYFPQKQKVWQLIFSVFAFCVDQILMSCNFWQTWDCCENQNAGLASLRMGAGTFSELLCVLTNGPPMYDADIPENLANILDVPIPTVRTWRTNQPNEVHRRTCEKSVVWFSREKHTFVFSFSSTSLTATPVYLCWEDFSWVHINRTETHGATQLSSQIQYCWKCILFWKERFWHHQPFWIPFAWAGYIFEIFRTEKLMHVLITFCKQWTTDLPVSIAAMLLRLANPIISNATAAVMRLPNTSLSIMKMHKNPAGISTAPVLRKRQKIDNFFSFSSIWGINSSTT